MGKILIMVCTTPQAHHLDIYEKLGLSSIPLPERKVVIRKLNVVTAKIRNFFKNQDFCLKKGDLGLWAFPPCR